MARTIVIAHRGGRSFTTAGQVALATGATNGSVALALPGTPQHVAVSVASPSRVDALLLTAHVVAGSVSSGGFSYLLSAAPDGADYVLSYLVTL